MERNPCATARAVALLALPHFRLGPEGARLIIKFLILIGRYLFSGQVLENFRPWVEETTGLDVTDVAPKPPPAKPAAPVRNTPFLDAVGALCKRFSDADEDRVFHAHGHTCQEVRSAARMSWPLQIWPVAEVCRGPSQRDQAACSVPWRAEATVRAARFSRCASVRLLACQTWWCGRARTSTWRGWYDSQTSTTWW